MARGWRKIFALYEGDKFVDEGTLIDMAARRGVKPQNLKFLLTPAHQRRLAKRKDMGHRLTLVEIEGEYEHVTTKRGLPNCG